MLKDKLKTLPMLPGCYLMKDNNGNVIYVGKAKLLKNRVNQYFVGSHNFKTTKMVSNVYDFDYIVTKSEKEAFILEYNLIKQYKPKYNIVFMDDSSYPYIRLTLDDYPTLNVVRDRKRIKNAKYFGPYPNVGYAREIVDLLNKVYPLRKCKNMQDKVCLYYHLNQCLGCCQYEVDPSIYEKLKENIIRFINGDTKQIKKDIIQKRDNAIEQLQYEQADEYQKLLLAIDHINSKSEVDKGSNINNCDVFNYYVENGYISIAGLLFRNGKLSFKVTHLSPLYDEPIDIFISYLISYYQQNNDHKCLIINKDIELYDSIDIKVVQPSKGKNKKLLDLAEENAKINLQQNFDIREREEKKIEDSLSLLANLLNCNTNRIELYDNSHISGTNAVAGQIVYIDGVASKKDYRMYKVHNKGDDFANMKEVLYRRFFKALQTNAPLPDLIIVDGGLPQINAAKQIVTDLDINVRIAGLAKNDKHNTNCLIDENLNVIDIPYDSDLFFMLTNWQDEVHRFATSYHYKLRDKQMVHSELDDIPNVGVKRKKLLLKEFKNIHNIKQATREQLIQLLGDKCGNSVYDFLQNQN